MTTGKCVATAVVVLALMAVAASQVQAGGSQDSSVSELPPKWPEFKAEKVSFAEAGLEPMSAPELIERLAGAQSIMNHSIVKSEAHTTWWNDYRNSTRITPIGPLRDYSGKMESHEEKEVRLDLDGRRCAVRERAWGTARIPIQERESFKPDPVYRSWLWDGTRHLFYSFFKSQPPGSVKIYEGATFSRRDIYVLGTDLKLRGYYDAAAGSLESVLLGARSVEPRSELEEIGGSACYVLDADTEFGKYVLWIDPAHGYNVARVEETRRKGDLYGQKRLPWPESVKEKRTVETIRFEQVADVWVPTECEYRSESTTANGHSKTLVRHKRTEVVLNPDFDALGSFVPDDVKEGAAVQLNPFSDQEVQGVWQNGSFVPPTEEKGARSEAQAQPSPKLAAENLAPDFTVETLDGKEFRLSDYRDKVVLLHFWAMSSEPCVADAPRLKSEYDALEEYRKHFAMISLCVDDLETRVRRHVKRNGLRWPQACVGRNSRIAADFGVTGVPAFIFVGPDGKVIPSDETSVMTMLEWLQAGGTRSGPMPQLPAGGG